MNKFSIRSFIGDILKSVIPLLIGITFVGTIYAVDLSLRPYILKVIIDRLPGIDGNTIIARLTGPIMLYVGMSIFIISMFRFRDYLHLNLQARTKVIINRILMQRMMQHSLVLYNNNFAGNLANKIKDVMSGIPDAIKIVDSLFAIFLSLLIATFTLLTINYQFCLLMLFWLVIFIGIVFYFKNPARKICEYSAEFNSLVLGQTVDILNNIVSVKLFSTSGEELEHISKLVKEKVGVDKRRDWFFLRLFSILGVTFIIYQSVGFILLIYWFKRGIVTIGDFALLTSINIAVINELWTVSERFGMFSEVMGNISQGLRVVLKPIDILDIEDAKVLSVKRGTIAFNDVSFNYPGIDAIFSGKNVVIENGQKVGLVGYSGGGKTTFVNLIMRLYEISAGQILIDDQNIQEVTQDSLHDNISMIPQDTLLFHRTLMENIRYGQPLATDEEVITAAKKAHAHDFIRSLPDGYASLVGDRGVKLSGGQRQRIAIARAILKNAPILILDEATSQLDSIIEKSIQNCLLNLMENKTAIVIAHRLSTLLHMDRILVFSSGKIVEDGTHSKLIAQNGLYKKLWDAQVGGFLSDDQEL